jgi:hypothetical protein
VLCLSEAIVPRTLLEENVFFFTFKHINIQLGEKCCF